MFCQSKNNIFAERSITVWKEWNKLVLRCQRGNICNCGANFPMTVNTRKRQRQWSNWHFINGMTIWMKTLFILILAWYQSNCHRIEQKTLSTPREKGGLHANVPHHYLSWTEGVGGLSLFPVPFLLSKLCWGFHSDHESWVKTVRHLTLKAGGHLCLTSCRMWCLIQN